MVAAIITSTLCRPVIEPCWVLVQTSELPSTERLPQERTCEACRATFAFCFDSEPHTKPDPNQLFKFMNVSKIHLQASLRVLLMSRKTKQRL